VLNVPWNQGDTFGFQIAYGVGALGYVAGGTQGSFALSPVTSKLSRWSDGRSRQGAKG
jgi:hypothetical protein